MSEATDFDLAADDWRSRGANVFRGDYAGEGEPDVWVTVEFAEEPETIAKRIAVALNAYSREIAPAPEPA